MENWLIIAGKGLKKINNDIKKIYQSKTKKYDATIDALKVRKRIEYLKTDGCERIKRDYNKKSERYWDDEFIIRDRLRKAELWKK